MRAARASLEFSGTLAWIRAGRISSMTQYLDTTSHDDHGNAPRSTQDAKPSTCHEPQKHLICLIYTKADIKPARPTSAFEIAAVIMEIVRVRLSR
jgi:hypothetical protein